MEKVNLSHTPCSPPDEKTPYNQTCMAIGTNTQPSIGSLSRFMGPSSDCCWVECILQYITLVECKRHAPKRMIHAHFRRLPARTIRLVQAIPCRLLTESFHYG